MTEFINTTFKIDLQQNAYEFSEFEENKGKISQNVQFTVCKCRWISSISLYD